MAAALAVVLLGVAVFLFARNARQRSSGTPPAPVVCESCGREFYIKTNDEEPVCPYCKAPASIRRLYFQCRQCGHAFVAYEWDTKNEMARVPGGEWVPKDQCPLEAVCPECGGPTKFVRDIRKVRQ